ncbi:hypothetical protein AB0E69_13510 [Kribbella sp. NPDC026611]|uniref:hypothetical protein n=1 Tax=Kribbella sp. NPDC026611 TaxID=3154911 RepID=UPI00341004CF
MAGSIAASVTGWISERPVVDLGFAAVVTAAHVRFGWASYRWVTLRLYEPDLASAVYGGVAGLVAIIGGLGAVAISVYMGASGQRAVAAKRANSVQLRRNWRAVFVGTVVAALLSIAGLLVHAVASRRLGLVILEFAVLLAIARFVRLAWLFDRLMALTDRDQTDQVHASAPDLNPRWAGKGKAVG